jgi:preprotein translocase subunit SecG
MFLFVTALHIVLCLFLVVVILLQPGKGADPGSAFGGGMTSSVFGPRGPANLLSRVTTVVAVLFMVTSVTLALYSNRKIMTGGDLDDAMQRLQQEQLEKKKQQSEGGSGEPVEQPGNQPPLPGAARPVGEPSDETPALDAPGAGE